MDQQNLAHRLLPPIEVVYQTVTANGRPYSGTPGQAVDVVRQDASVLEANKWSFVALSGTTAQRPTLPALDRGFKYFDTTLNALIVFDGATWRSPVDGSAV